MTAVASATIYAGEATSATPIPGVNAHILPVALDARNPSSSCGGGGIYNAGTLTVRNSTIAYNNFQFYGGGGYGGGICIIGFGTLSMSNTVLANNTVGVGGIGPDLLGNLSSSGYNLIGNSSGGSGYAPTDILNVDPLLGPLMDNGGPTLTHALLPGSPAIDAGDNTDAPQWDQRGPGYPRIVNGTIDIGAFEVQATSAPSVSRTSAEPVVARAFVPSTRMSLPDQEAWLNRKPVSPDAFIVSEAPSATSEHDDVSAITLRCRGFPRAQDFLVDRRPA